MNFRPRSGPKSGINDPFFEIIAFSDRKDVTSAGLMVLIFKIHFWSILGPFFAQKWPNFAQNGPFWAIFWRSGLEIGKNDRFSEKIVLNNSLGGVAAGLHDFFEKSYFWPFWGPKTHILVQT